MENGKEQSFAELLEESYVEPTRYEPGKKIIAPIVRIEEDWTFLDLSGKSEGFFSTSEIKDENGELEAKEGDSIAVYFLTAEKGGMRFTTKLGAGAEAQAHLQEAFNAAIPVEGTVEKEIKGGYEVKIAGSVRSFCPFSQAGLQRVEPDEFVGRTLYFRIIEYKENGRNIIVSHRSILEEEQKEKIALLKDSLEVGAKVSGAVTSIKKFGAFVRLDEGLEGLLPVSEICWGRVEDINERLQVGQRVDLQVMKLDWENERFSFSLKNILPDPWQSVSENYAAGAVVTGKVARLTTFGAFVTLEEGVDGLIHIGALAKGRRLGHPREAVSEGQELEVKVEKVDTEERRIALVPTEDLCPHLKGKKQVDTPAEETGQRDYVQYKKEKQKKNSGSLGTLGDLLKAKLGK